jgi:hypothetical protein
MLHKIGRIGWKSLLKCVLLRGLCVSCDTSKAHRYASIRVERADS